MARGSARWGPAEGRGTRCGRRSPARGWPRGAGAGLGWGRGARRRRPAARLEHCVRRRHAHTCPPPFPAASLAAGAERARLNLPFILGPGPERATATTLSAGARAPGDAPHRGRARRRVPERAVGAHGRRRTRCRRPRVRGLRRFGRAQRRGREGLGAEPGVFLEGGGGRRSYPCHAPVLGHSETGRCQNQSEAHV